MATNQFRQVIQTLRGAALPNERASLTDGQLLERYVRSREEAAFAALVRRHGPMVWGVCRRVLGNHQDAEDAFQATFLVLARKAAAVVSVASWLHGVAHRTALKARSAAARRQAREKQVMAMPEPEAVQPDLWDDLKPLLDKELSRLPEKYRGAIVLCDLEGKTRKEAALQMQVPEGTVASRLATARAMLAKRLTGRGVAVSATALAAVLSQQAASASVPVAVVSATITAAGLFAAGQAAAGALSVRAVALTEGALRSVWPARLAITTAVVVVIAAIGAVAVALIPPPQADRGAVAVPAEKVADREVVEAGGDWPQWRGPNRDGVVHGVKVPAKWPRSLREEWQAPVGGGISSPVVVGSNVYVFTREKEDEVVVCLDLASGKEKWRSQPYPAPFEPHPAATGFGKYPRSTPTVAGGRVFTFGVSGVLSCLDASTGKLLWRQNRSENHPAYGAATSPLVADGLCIVHVGGGDKNKGGLTAFDVKTGEVKWSYADGSGPPYGSPILVDLAGERQVATFTSWNFLGVSLATGKRLWRVEAPFDGQERCITPVAYRDLLLFAEYKKPPRAIRMERTASGITAKDVWMAKGLNLYYSSPVLAGGLLFGFSTRKGTFFCLDAQTGDVRWESDVRVVGNASVLHAGNVILFLTDRGQLVVVKATARAYEPLAEYQVSNNATHAHPVFLGDRLLIKDLATLRSLRIEPDAGKP
jgi:RNA polymerase sigma factor (sigma-70 family)